MANVTLLHYNNYFNRIVKKEASYAAYLIADPTYNKTTNINFVPGDGISTSLVLGTSSLVMDYDYLIVTELENSTEAIKSMWFIIENHRTRDGQWELVLHRDVIADNYDDVVAAPTFVEKAYIDDVTNPLLFNSESMTYNQIKMSETFLKDNTGCGWVVGYIPQDAFKSGSKQINKDIILETSADITVSSLSSWAYWQYCSINNAQKGATTNSSTGKTLALKCRAKYVTAYNTDPSNSGSMYVMQDSDLPDYKYSKPLLLFTSSNYTSSWDTNSSTLADIWSSTMVGQYWSTFDGSNFARSIQGQIVGNTSLWTDINTYVNNRYPADVVIVPASTITAMQALDGKTIKDTSTGIVYRITVTNAGVEGNVSIDTEDVVGASIVTKINSALSNAGVRQNQITMSHETIWRQNQAAADILVGYNGSVYSIVLNQVVTFASVEIDYNRNHVSDAPYDMFCIPYSDTARIKYGSGTNDYCNCNKTLAVGMAEEIARDAGTGSIYDVQLLPYCPCKELTNQVISLSDPVFDIRNISSDLIKDTTYSYTRVYPINQTTFEQMESLYGQLYDENYREIYYYSSNNTYYYYRDIDASAKVVGALLWCTSCTRTFDINTTITVSNSALERKVENECDMYRLCSGNYSGIFEFSPAKGSGVTGFQVDCTFKPYTPYIHVIPKIHGLYGNFAEFNDARGLICGGDFSLTQLSNTWANYELQNKNYQQIFDRQIQNMDVNNSIAQTEAKWQAAAGTVQGTVQGAVAGGMVGGGWGAAAGAVLSGGMSLAGGIADYQNLLKRQEEARSYAIDMYGYQLGNIKAIPTSLSKNTSLTPNLKIFPFIEKYSCTDDEKNALRDKITYNGMTVMKVSTPSEFIVSGTPHYLKGQVIRIPGLEDDSHMAYAIYEEINKGVYI